MSSKVKRYVCGALVCLLACFCVAQGATVYVSDGSGSDSNDGSSWALAKKTITGGLGVAGSGDTVLVTNGTYSFPHFVLEWVRSGETLRSVNGAEYTTITPYEGGSPATRVEGTIDGFTIKNGASSSGYSGGGILLIGGVAVNCVVTNCSSGKSGGGIYIQSSGVVSNCLITGCSSSGDGAGVYVHDGLLVNSSVIGCSGGGQGGGVLVNSSREVKNCIIRRNSTTGNGGGVCLKSSATMYNCLVAGNQTTADGGGVHGDGATVESCTIVGNTALGGTRTGGFYASWGGTYIRNTILYYNENLDGTLGSVDMVNSCFGVAPSASMYDDNITNAPDFVATGSGYGTNHVFGDYMLRPESPCVDTGLNRTWMTGALDLAGTNRIIDGTVNRGAYEKTGTGLDPQTITFAQIPNQTRNSRVGLAATASSGLTVSFTVVSGPARISGLTNLSFTGVGEVTVKASQAGDDTYDPAPDVTRTFMVYGTSTFRLSAFALTNNVAVRWPDPLECGISNRNVLVRFATSDYPATTASGTQLYTGTNQNYEHNGLTPGQEYYYSVFVSQDGTTFTNPP